MQMQITITGTSQRACEQAAKESAPRACQEALRWLTYRWGRPEPLSFSGCQGEANLGVIGRIASRSRG